MPPPHGAPPFGTLPPAAGDMGAGAPRPVARDTALIERLERMEATFRAAVAPGAAQPAGGGTELATVLSRFADSLEGAEKDKKKQKSKSAKPHALEHSEAPAPRGHGSALAQTRDPFSVDVWGAFEAWDGMDAENIQPVADLNEAGEYVPFFARPANQPHGPNGMTEAEVQRQRTESRAEDSEKTGLVHRTAMGVAGWTILNNDLHVAFGSTSAEQRLFVGHTAVLPGQDPRDSSKPKYFTLPKLQGTFTPTMMEPFADTMKRADVRFGNVTERDFTSGVDHMVQHTLAANTATRFLLNEMGRLVAPVFRAGDVDRWGKFQDLVASVLEISGQAMLGVSKEASIMAHITRVSASAATASIVPVSAQVSTARDAARGDSNESKLLAQSAAGSRRTTTTASSAAPSAAAKKPATASIPSIVMNIPDSGGAGKTAAAAATAKPAAGTPNPGKRPVVLAPAGSNYRGTQCDPHHHAAKDAGAKEQP